MPATALPTDYLRIRKVGSLHELVTTPFGGGVNALCWERELTGDFGEVVRLLGPGEGIVALDEERLLGLPVSAAGRAAVARMVEDLRLLRDLGLVPELNCIHEYPRDEEPGIVRADVFSFHVDSAPGGIDTYLCTYHGRPSEGLPNEEARRHVDIPETRAELLKEYGGEEGPDFEGFLSSNCYDLHYSPTPQARPYSFGIGNLWRIAVKSPECPVPPCIHRAPETAPGDPARLLLIS